MPLKTVARGAGGGGGGSGTVTSVNVSGGTTGLTTTGGPITTAGEITIGGALNIANGGTGQTSKTAAFDALAPTTTKGDLVVYDGTDNIRLAVGTNGYYLKADSTTGSGLAWDSVAAGGVTSVTATAPLASSGGATPDISLTGIVPIANGGTGETTDVAAFDALAPTTTKGDIIVFDGSDNIRLGVGTNGYVLTADTASASGVSWASVGGGGSGTTTYAVTFNNGGTGDASGTTFDGSVARTISYNTFGAANSGANTNITSLDSITGGISSPDYIQFDTTATVTGAAGRLYWDDEDNTQTFVYGLAGGALTAKVDQEQYFRIKASSAITKGQVVMFTGTLGASGGLTGAPATGLTADQANYILGVATENISLNAWGYVTFFGEIRGLNTSGGAESWANGTVLYYNPAVTGGLTDTKPSVPNAIAIVAAVVYADSSNGVLFIRPTYGSVLGGTDGNVNFSALSNGDVIVYDSVNAYWENVSQSNLTVGSAALATDIAGGAANQLLYQDTIGSTSFATAPTVTNSFLKWNGSAFAWDTVTSGTVTSVGLTMPTGFSVANSPITGSGTLAVTTTLSGILKGNGSGFTTATSGTDYAPATSGTSSQLLGSDGSGAFTNVTVGTGLSYSGGTLSATATGTVTSVGLTMPTGFSVANSPVTGSGTLAVTTSLSGILKGDGSGFTTATSGTDYAPATSGTSILKGSGTGGFSNAAAGTDYQAPITLTTTGTSGAATFISNTLNIPQYSGGGGGSSVILENQRTISSNYTVTDGYNGLSVGPVAISSNVSVTVGTDERWVVLNF